MNLCTCCYDEVTGIWCGCEEQHDQDMSVMAEARAHITAPPSFISSEGWSYYCSACSRYISGDVYYLDN